MSGKDCFTCDLWETLGQYERQRWRTEGKLSVVM